jgi:hypothetical protein
MEGFCRSRLGWRREADWFAVLTTEEKLAPEDLVAALVARQKQRPAGRELNWARTIKTDRTCYVDALAKAKKDLQEGKRSYADFLTAFASDLGTDDNDQLKPTAFYMTSGKQEFLKEARNLANRLVEGVSIGRRKKTSAEMFREALFGPWRYEDPQHSLGWDPSTERLHALRAKSPTKEASEGVSGAVWLAFEALPLFPCFLTEGRLATTGFHTEGSTRQERVTYLTWPLWEFPVPIDTVRSLLSLSELTEENPLGILRARGIEAVFRCERYKVKTQGSYFILRPACPCL